MIARFSVPITLKLRITLLLGMLITLLSTLVYGQETFNKSITVDGIERSYLIYVPASYTAENPVPVLFNFHGYTSFATAYIGQADFRPIANREGFLVVLPQGSRDSTGATHFNVGWMRSTVDDVAFTSAVLDQVISDYAVDEKRVYATGFSNGGFFSHKLACELSDRIAAIASVSGAVTPGQFSNCSPIHPMPVLQIHGTNDGIIPYEGNIFSESVEDILAFWINFSNTSEVPITEELPDVNPKDGSTVTFQLYANGDNGSVVEHYKINGGRHNWPGHTGDPTTNRDINASEVIWEFFSRYTIDGSNPTTLSNENTAEKPIQFLAYPNPNEGKLSVVHSFITPVPFAIMSVQGDLLREGSLEPGTTTIDISNIAKGVYFIMVENTAHRIIKK